MANIFQSFPKNKCFFEGYLETKESTYDVLSMHDSIIDADFCAENRLVNTKPTFKYCYAEKILFY